MSTPFLDFLHFRQTDVGLGTSGFLKWDTYMTIVNKKKHCQNQQKCTKKNAGNPTKWAPTSNNWGEITPIGSLMNPVTHEFSAIHKGPMM